MQRERAHAAKCGPLTKMDQGDLCLDSTSRSQVSTITHDRSNLYLYVRQRGRDQIYTTSYIGSNNSSINDAYRAKIGARLNRTTRKRRSFLSRSRSFSLLPILISISLFRGRPRALVDGFTASQPIPIYTRRACAFYL